jgi:hypothetical protein
MGDIPSTLVRELEREGYEKTSLEADVGDKVVSSNDILIQVLRNLLFPFVSLLTFDLDCDFVEGLAFLDFDLDLDLDFEVDLDFGWVGTDVDRLVVRLLLNGFNEATHPTAGLGDRSPFFSLDGI